MSTAAVATAQPTEASNSGSSQTGRQSREPIVLAQADSGKADARAMVQLVNQIEAFNRELNKLRGKVEELQNSVINAEKRQKDMYLDLDTRLRRIESSNTSIANDATKITEAMKALQGRVEKLEQSAAAGAAAMSTAPVAATGETEPTTDALSAGANAAVYQAYEAAMGLYRGAKYQDAIAAFQAIVNQNPQHPLAVNAQYWTGDAYYQLRAYRSAIDAQKQLIERYPNGNKVPDAMLNMGSAYIGLGELQTARELWDKLIANYPGSRAAANARERLERLP